MFLLLRDHPLPDQTLPPAAMPKDCLPSQHYEEGEGARGPRRTGKSWCTSGLASERSAKYFLSEKIAKKDLRTIPLCNCFLFFLSCFIRTKTINVERSMLDGNSLSRSRSTGENHCIAVRINPEIVHSKCSFKFFGMIRDYDFFI